MKSATINFDNRINVELMRDLRLDAEEKPFFLRIGKIWQTCKWSDCKLNVIKDRSEG